MGKRSDDTQFSISHHERVTITVAGSVADGGAQGGLLRIVLVGALQRRFFSEEGLKFLFRLDFYEALHPIMSKTTKL